jgi:hypothetical protein
MTSLQWFYSSFTVDSVNPGEQRRTQNGLGKQISNPGEPIESDSKSLGSRFESWAAHF